MQLSAAISSTGAIFLKLKTPHRFFALAARTLLSRQIMPGDRELGLAVCRFIAVLPSQNVCLWPQVNVHNTSNCVVF
jgi:hypothetical protein